MCSCLRLWKSSHICMIVRRARGACPSVCGGPLCQIPLRQPKTDVKTPCGRKHDITWVCCSQKLMWYVMAVVVVFGSHLKRAGTSRCGNRALLGFLGRSWAILGDLGPRSGTKRGCFGGHSGPAWARLSPFWAILGDLGRSWSLLGDLGRFLGPLKIRLRSCRILGGPILGSKMGPKIVKNMFKTRTTLGSIFG